jgi:hypothetical protein
LSFELEEINAGSIPEMEQSNGQDEQEDEFAFRLFGGPEKREPQKVRLADDEEDNANIERPESHYFATVDDEKRKEFESASVSGETVIRESKEPYPGMRMPWRVIDYTELARRTKIEKQKRRRPGKKMRLQRRRQNKDESARCRASSGSRALVVYGPERLYSASRLPSVESLGAGQRYRGGGNRPVRYWPKKR